MRREYRKTIEGARFFTDNEAWNLFRLAAFGEAFGWTLLIGSLLFKHYVTPGNNIPIDIAGQVHGTIFLIYIVSVVVLHPSMHWSPQRTLLAGLVSVPPYGTLVFEQLIARKRHAEASQAYRQLIVRGLILYKDKLLVIQPQENATWYLPGGEVTNEESAEQALYRIITSQTGVEPVIGHLVYIWQHNTKHVQQLEFLFSITNMHEYHRVDLAAIKKDRKQIDEISFVKPGKSYEIEPEFLRTTNLTQASIIKNKPVIFIQEHN